MTAPTVDPVTSGHMTGGNTTREVASLAVARKFVLISRLAPWSPAVLLLLYVAGFVVANSHYGRFEMVKPTLLAGRYLSAGLLFLVFSVAPAVSGFAGAFHGGSFWSKASWRTALLGLVVLLGYAVASAGYAYFLATTTVIEPGLRAGWTFMGSSFVIGGVAGISWRDLPIGKTFAVYKASSIAILLISMLVLAYSFGVSLYPSVKPHFGGAAVLNGYVVLKPAAPRELKLQVSDGALPFVDMDERFLYVVGCSHQPGDSTPEVILIPLDFVAAGRLKSNGESLLAIPSYVKQHRCNATEKRVHPKS